MSMLHHRQLTGFVWPEPEDQSEERMISDIRKYGCHLVGNLPEAGTPQYVFSIGLYANFGQPEIVIFDANGHRARHWINAICDHVARGERLSEGESIPLEEHHVRLVGVPSNIYSAYLRDALWFYDSLPRRFPCLQLVWPDHAGRFPRDTGVDAHFNAVQPVLGAKRYLCALTQWPKVPERATKTRAPAPYLQ